MGCERNCVSVDRGVCVICQSERKEVTSVSGHNIIQFSNERKRVRGRMGFSQVMYHVEASWLQCVIFL